MASKQASRAVKIVGVTGGSCSGKTTVCKMIVDALPPNSRVCVISQDRFYRPMDPAHVDTYNFDHPDAFDMPLLAQTLRELKEHKSVDVPTYDMTTCKRGPTEHIAAADVVIVEGILLLFDAQVRELLDMKIFVDLDSDTRLSRRVARDIALGRDLDVILNRYMRFVKPAFEQFTLPTKKYADVIIPRGSENKVALDLIAQHIHSWLEESPTEPEPEGSGSTPRSNRERFDSISRPH